MSKQNSILLFFSTILFLVSSPLSKAQSDTVFLGVNGFMNYLKNYHPILQKYRLVTEQAKQQLLQSKGQFDPNVKVNYDQKNFEDKNYYNDLYGQLKVPTWYGPDFKLGYENNSGQFINPESLTPSEGLLSAGFSMPLAQGLIINDRLATLKQAKIFVRMAGAERTKFINKFLFSAIKQYWEWYVNYNKLQRFNESYAFANQRYLLSVQRALQGDLAPIDTVEAAIQRQNMLMNRTNAEVDYFNATMMLNNYLWKDEQTPLELSSNVVPLNSNETDPRFITDTLQRSLQWAGLNNPEIQKLRFKIDQLDVEKRFAQNKLLPKINLDYNWLSSYNNFSDAKSGFNANNSKLGGSLAMPIFLRAERGKLNQTKIKLLEANYELQQGQKELDAGLKAIANECNGLWRQIGLQDNVVRNSVKLRNAEQLNFDNGESSLFLINTRETSLLNNQLKFYDIIGKYEKAKASFYVTAGNLGQVYGIE